MKPFIIPAIAFTAGLATASVGYLSPSRASAANSMGTMRVTMSVSDMQMQSAMNKMNATMKDVHMSGNVDRDFMMMMVPHHQSAIDMARVELRYGRKPVLQAMAHDIISSQSNEISRMRKWLRQWYGV